MKKLLGLIVLITITSCSFGTERHSLIIRNATDSRVEVSIWLKQVYFPIPSDYEIEILVGDEVDISTPFGVAFCEMTDDNTLELHKDGYYLGEQTYRYWNECDE